MKQRLDARGYFIVGMKGKPASVHRLVCSAFHGAPAFYACCRHLNGIQTDNRASNLEWGTHRENSADAAKHGTTAKGSRNAQAKLKESDIPIIRNRRAQGDSIAAIARAYSVSERAVDFVVQRVTWQWIP